MWKKFYSYLYKRDLESIPYFVGVILALILLAIGFVNWDCSSVAEMYNTEYKVSGMSCYFKHDGKWIQETYFKWIMASE